MRVARRCGSPQRQVDELPARSAPNVTWVEGSVLPAACRLAGEAVCKAWASALHPLPFESLQLPGFSLEWLRARQPAVRSLAVQPSAELAPGAVAEAVQAIAAGGKQVGDGQSACSSHFGWCAALAEHPACGWIVVWKCGPPAANLPTRPPAGLPAGPAAPGVASCTVHWERAATRRPLLHADLRCTAGGLPPAAAAPVQPDPAAPWRRGAAGLAAKAGCPAAPCAGVLWQ